MSVERPRRRDHILLSIDSHTTSELRFLPAATPAAPWTLLAPRVADREVEADHLGTGWLLRMNDTGPNFRVVQVPEDDPAGAPWTDLLPHRDDVMLRASRLAGH